MESDADSSMDCLCLVCRQIGHVVEKCPRYVRWQESSGPEGHPPAPDAELALPSPPLNPFLAPQGSTETMCQRCSQLGEALNDIARYRPFVVEDLEDNHTKRATKKATQIQPLGPVRSLRLLATCPLCRLLFDVSRLKDEEEVELVRSGGQMVVVTGWTVHRFEQELYWKGHDRGKGPYAKCTYTSVTDWSLDDGIVEPNRIVGDAEDAIGFTPPSVGECGSESVPALGVRPVDPKTPDYGTIKGWLRRCGDLHRITCRPLASESLKQIKLVDVETRRIVTYPPEGCDYVALSYVWGDVEQRHYGLGGAVQSAPATLEDAMVVTRNLGKRYLWADSLCIDQGNEEEKVVQIALMSAIYSGACATIICLSGQSARSGLPRVGTLEGVIPQLSCEILGKRLLNVMPTLAQQISWSPWASRAWTYQEGLLSPRRLFFTNHQVYFECNSSQCCESLDDSNSPFHLQTDEQRQVALEEAVEELDEIEGPECIVGRGVLRDPFRPIPISKDVEEEIEVDHFVKYLDLVHTYTMRKMTHDADALHAFSAVLTRLEKNCYKKGFVYGLPVEELPRTLVLFYPALPRYRLGFPTWSWAGWEGEVSDSVIDGAGGSHEAIMPPLRVWKAGRDGQPELVYNFNPTPDIIKELEGVNDDGPDSDSDSEEHEGPRSPDTEPGYESDEETQESGDDEPQEDINYGNDPVFHLSRKMLKETKTAVGEVCRNELLIEGIVVRLSPIETPKDHYSESETEDEECKSDARCFVRLEGQSKTQRMKFYGHNAVHLVEQRSEKQQEFLLVSREPHEKAADKVYNALVLIDRNKNVAHRVGVASLRLDQVELLGHLKPKRKTFKLR